MHYAYRCWSAPSLCDTVQQLEENVRLAREFTPLNERQMQLLAAGAEPVSKAALFFRFVSGG